MKEKQEKTDEKRISESKSWNDLEEKIVRLKKRIQAKPKLGFKIVYVQTYHVPDYKFKS